MISEHALAAVCRPAILGRARVIAQREGRIWDRSCSYEGRLTHLSARIDSSSGYEDSYDASLIIDETADQVFSYECTCPAARRFSGPCKHSIALALDFNRNADSYEGFSELEHVSTSPALAAFLSRTTRSARPRVATASADQPGSVRVEPRLLRDNDLFLGLRLMGPRGTYVVRDLGSFEANISEGTFFEYGKRLAFTHKLEAFAEQDRDLVRLVCRCVRNRRSYAGTRAYGHVYTTSGSSLTIGKELRLSGPETDELIALLMGRQVSFEMAAGLYAGKTRQLEVVDGDPDISLSLTSSAADAFRIERGRAVEVFGTGERVCGPGRPVVPLLAAHAARRGVPAAGLLQPGARPADDRRGRTALLRVGPALPRARDGGLHCARARCAAPRSPAPHLRAGLPGAAGNLRCHRTLWGTQRASLRPHTRG